jgi:hypothetical protein
MVLFSFFSPKNSQDLLHYTLYLFERQGRRCYHARGYFFNAKKPSPKLARMPVPAKKGDLHPFS